MVEVAFKQTSRCYVRCRYLLRPIDAYRYELGCNETSCGTRCVAYLQNASTLGAGVIGISDLPLCFSVTPRPRRESGMPSRACTWVHSQVRDCCGGIVMGNERTTVGAVILFLILRLSFVFTIFEFLVFCFFYN